MSGFPLSRFVAQTSHVTAKGNVDQRPVRRRRSADDYLSKQEPHRDGEDFESKCQKLMEITHNMQGVLDEMHSSPIADFVTESRYTHFKFV